MAEEKAFWRTSYYYCQRKGFPSSIGIFHDLVPEDKPPIDYLLLMCTSGPGPEENKALIQPLMAKLLDKAGFERRRATYIAKEGKSAKNYGS